MSYFLAAWLAVYGVPDVRGTADRPVSMTIYNDGFAVVREKLTLDLKAGKNHVSVAGVTSLLEPESVILHDRTGLIDLRIQEQNYRADVVTKQSMLQLYEGKTIEFRNDSAENGLEYIVGKIIRAGASSSNSSSQEWEYDEDGNWTRSAAKTSIIEVDGKVQIGLPGEPVFPKVPDDSILQPTLTWTLTSDEVRKVSAELSYLWDPLESTCRHASLSIL